MKIEEHFGKVILRLRKARHISQAGLADIAQMHKQNLRQIEHGAVSPTMYTVYKLAASLGIKTSELLAMLEAELLVSE